MKRWRYWLGCLMALVVVVALPAAPSNAGQQSTSARSAAKPPRPVKLTPPPKFEAERKAHDATVDRARKPGSIPATRSVRAEPANTTYDVPAMPQRMRPGDEDSTEATLTNTTQAAFTAKDWVLTYRWTTREGRDVTNPGNQHATALPKDLAPGEKATFQAKVEAPDPLFGNSREEFTVHWDLYNKTTRQWLSKSGVPPLAQDVTVENPTSGQLGLEKFYQYSGMNTGAGSNLMVNQFSGNAVFGYNAFSHPGRGLQTFARMTYNSMDTEDSGAGPGWTLSASTIQRLGTPLHFAGLGHPVTITLTDGDGTSHEFKLNKHGSLDPAKWTYDAPAGVHWFLQKNAKSGDRAWTMTRPDRTKAYFDDQGYQSYLADKNGNELKFTYERTHIGGRNTGMLKNITDATGRRTLTVDYYQRGDGFAYFVNDKRLIGTNLTLDPIINKVKSITDVSGRRLDFAYSDHGLLQEVVDGAGTWAAKTFGFFYDNKFLENPKLIRVNDPLGHGTQLQYNDDHGRRWIKALVERRGKTTGFGYADPDGHDGAKVQSTVTDANGHTSTYLIDGFGRPERATNAKGETRTAAWDDDNNVRRLEEPNKAASTWLYDRKTGYLLESRTPEANKNNTAPTKITYRTGLDGHVADMATKTSPEGRKWSFEQDAKGNLLAVTDPKGSVTRHQYDAHGQVTKSTDANGHATTFDDYDQVGYPRNITDALGHKSTSVFDVLGNVVSTSDALGKASTYTYDVFRRPLSSKVPKNQAAGDFIFTPGPVYDRNDNVTSETVANGAVTRSTYNEIDKPVGVFAPKDTDDSDQRLTTMSYDNAGNLIKQTEPKGSLTDEPDDFSVRFTYDVLNRPVRITNAAGGVVTSEYDNAGNLVKVVDARKNATPDAADYTAKTEFDLDRRPVRSIDALGKETSQRYDRDGLVVAERDQDGNETLLDLDERGRVKQIRVPHDKNGDEIVYRTTRFEFDNVGNRTRTITPRGVETADDPDDFVQETVYDELNRIKEQLTPYDKDDSRYNKPDKTTYTYDPVGNLSKVSTPPSSGESVRNDTTYAYYDNGWIKTSTDPWDIDNSYDYDALGQQTKNTLTSAGGSVTRTQDWEFYPSGNLAKRSDQGAPVGRDEVLVDNSDTGNTAALGGWKRSRSVRNVQGPDAASRPAGKGDNRFTWQLNIPRTGKYEVFVRYPKVSGAAKDATYTVSHSGGTVTKAVDQRQNPSRWVSLGSYPFAEGRGPAVTLSDKASGTVAADAVKLVRDNSRDVDQERKEFQHRYDANGNAVQIDDRTPGARISAYAMSYDGLNRLAELKEKAGDDVKNKTAFTYDENGNTKSRTHDEVWSSFDYDARDLMERVTNAKTPDDPDKNVLTLGYNDRGELTQQVKPNGNTVGISYYLDGAPKRQIENRKDTGAVVQQHDLQYEPNGNPAKDVARLMNADDHSATIDNTYTFTYDPRDRIAKSVKTGDKPDTESYVHDANNNVTEQTVDGKTTKHDYDRNRLISSTLGGVTSTHNYDPLGRLDTVSTGGENVTRYKYDGFDRIAEHIAGSGGNAKKTLYTYDPHDRTSTETRNAGGTGEKKRALNYLSTTQEVLSEEEASKVIKTYQSTPTGQKLTQIKHNDDGKKEVSHYVYHPKGDIEALTKEDGNTRTTYGYTSYGQNDVSKFTGKDKPDPGQPDKEPYNNYRFNAHRFDQSSGTYDMGFRNYDPGLNRFLTRDMYDGALADLSLATDPLTGSRYAFAGGNPISNVEIDGHGFWSIVSDIGHAVLDVAGLVPGLGEIADGVNAAWYGVECIAGVEGACADAALSAAAMIPGLGWGATAAKWGKRGVDAANAASDAGKRVDDVPTKVPDGSPAKAPDTPPAKGPDGPPAKDPAQPAPQPKPEQPAAPPAACKVPNSFAPGTQVLMADGTRKAIEDVKVGDSVAATDPESGDTRARLVMETITGKGGGQQVGISVDTDGKKGDGTGYVVATEAHPFWVPDLGQWVKAGELKAGTWLQTSAGTWVQVSKVTKFAGKGPVHNLSVSGTHTYHVAAGAKNLLVHNCGEAAAEAARQRADAIHGALHPFAQTRRTTAVVQAVRPDGSTVSVIASSGRGLSPAQRAMLGPDEIPAPGRRGVHAEMAAMDYITAKGWAPVAGGASRNVCSKICAPNLSSSGATVGGPSFRGRGSGKRLFWW